MKLTKSEAVRLHREMWNWIAKEIELSEHDDYYCLDRLKQNFIRLILKNEDAVKNFCFCCEYATDNKTREFDCNKCPLVWGTENSVENFFCESGIKTYFDIPDGLPVPDVHTEGLWTNVRELIWEGRNEDAAKYARYIANLPEKEDV